MNELFDYIDQKIDEFEERHGISTSFSFEISLPARSCMLWVHVDINGKNKCGMNRILISLNTPAKKIEAEIDRMFERLVIVLLEELKETK